MAANNLRILKGGGTVMRYDTEANVTVGIREGDGIQGASGTGTNYASLVLDGNPEQETDFFIGVSKSAGTETTAANGVIDVEHAVPGLTIMECLANTTSNVDTDAKILALKFDFVAFDRSADTAAGVLTVDENEGTDAVVHGIQILDGRASDGMMFITPAMAGWGNAKHDATAV